ncbi:MAG TPA: hypothetical protein VIM79_01000 [Niastella sp.]
MAKSSDNIITHSLSGTLDNLTFVNSKAYGPHLRRKRGSKKKAVLNKAMKESRNRLLQVNQMASLIFRSISNEHKDGKLWPRLLSKLRLQLREYNFNDVSCLFRMECHTKRTLEKMLLHLLDVKIGKIVNRRMNIPLDLPYTPLYDKKYLKEFQISMHVLYPDFERVKLKKEVVYSDVLHKANCPKTLSFTVPVPAKATEYAVFMKVTECEDGIALNYPQSTGMRCVAVGTIERKLKNLTAGKAPARKKKRVAKKAPVYKSKKNKLKSS